MSLLGILGLARSDSAPAGRNPLADAIRDRLKRLPLRRAEFVAAFAGLLMRVAYADLEISPAERAALPRLIADHAGLSPDESATVAEIVTRQATGFAGIEYALLTRAFNEVATEQEKEQLIDCLYAIATAGSTVSVVEDDEIRAVARALMLSHQQFIAIRHRYKEQLEIIQAARQLRR
ncbi:MAG: TerB family tellurite resistance protein [Candidatus Binatia bacterium]